MRTCGTLRAGVNFFPLPRFLRQEPGGDQGQGLMMMPATPRADLVVGQARLALGALETLFNSMPRLDHACELRRRRIGRGVGQVIVVVERRIRMALPNHDQDLQGFPALSRSG